MNDHIYREWHFHRFNDRQEWTVPERMTGMVLGGSLWLKVDSEGTLHTDLNQIYANASYEIASPGKLGIPSVQARKVRIRLLNLSPETDGFLKWTKEEEENPDTVAGTIRFAMNPYDKQWQEIVCHLDEVPWEGTLDRIRLTMAPLGRMGDILIDRIAITDGERRELAVRPDLHSTSVVPVIRLPGIPQQDLQKAFDVLDDCLVTDVPARGFTQPFLAPGGYYDACWWMLDTSLALTGTQWVNFPFTENVMRGFFDVQAQNPDGRIDLYGGAPIRGMAGDLSAIPRYFEAAYDTARRTGDEVLREQIYRSMCGYLAWWVSPVKLDPHTGLVTGFFEESFGLFTKYPQTVAQVDLNVAVALGFCYAAVLAGHLGFEEEARMHRSQEARLAAAINDWLWDEERGVYLNYDVIERKRLTNLLCTTFDPMRMRIAGPTRLERLLPQLIDPALFNWGKIALTSVAMTDPTYCVLVGRYNASAWYGDIWTMRNIPVMAGLRDNGKYDLAAELTWNTICNFSGNYYEFLEPEHGQGHGVELYAWTAAQYIQSIVEFLFGVDIDRLESRLRLAPLIPQALFGQRLVLERLLLPGKTPCRMGLEIESTESGHISEMTLTFDGDIGLQELELIVPHHAGRVTVTATDLLTGEPLAESASEKRHTEAVGFSYSASLVRHVKFVFTR